MLSFGPWSDVLFFGKTLFELVDFFVSSIILPLGGLVMSLLAGWLIKDRLLAEVNQGRGVKVGTGFIICLKYIAPLASVIIIW